MSAAAPLTLGIETSCDETAVAVLRGEDDLLANAVYSQADIHAQFGGVVPEVASRNHVSKIPYIVSDALREAGITLSDISLVAATYGPGLVGPLLVGLSYGKGVAYGLKVPFIGVNHLEGHIFAHRLSAPGSPTPFMVLLVSGGHTSLVDVSAYGRYQLVGSTVDDAAGEALDKIGKMIGLGYPAGAEIDRMAGEGNPKAIPFPRPMASSSGFDFSFSGLKTSVLYHLRKHPRERPEDIAASVLASVVDILVGKSIEAARRFHRKRLTVVGGVAANSRLRSALTAAGTERGIEVSFPPLAFCTDNAAMIAAVGAYRHFTLGESHPLSLRPAPSIGFEELDRDETR
ncbi:tRNA (adenosine(37)-N6)-threonylcarbamoyltransferase complex transferase subunit TsaD [Candidatus Bipolaricaulota bacterium]|nr:tRNA (adenosine(37)-N6)-threonylcarbamoyltransferase complex transferase subunit TsaD [Candidatus Bipolaricaulota bacterium]